MRGAAGVAVLVVASAHVDPPEDDAITVAAVGDVLFGRYRPDRSYRLTTRAADPFVSVREILSAATSRSATSSRR